MIAAANPMLPEIFRVRSRRRELADTFSLTLSPEHNGRPLGFRPGQFNMLYVFGVGEVPISMSGDPAKTDFVHTVRAVGAVTRAMARLETGDALGVRGPFGSAWPVEKVDGRDVVLIAGGIGLAPLRPVVYWLLANRRRFRKAALLYGARSSEDVLYADELRRWERNKSLDVQVTVDRAAPGWTRHVGVVTQLISQCLFDPRNVVVFLCGPEVMMRFSILELETRGVSDGSIFLSLERNMKCAVGYCGHCQLGPEFVCKDGAVLSYSRLKPFLRTREL